MFFTAFVPKFCLLAGILFMTGCGQKAPMVFDGTDLRPDRVYRIEANPEKGFHAAYFLLIPETTHAVMKTEPVFIAVTPNNSGKTSDDIGFHEERAAKRTERNREVAADLRGVVLIPGFPRPKAHRKIYTHALDRDTMTTRIPGLSRPDLQLVAMIDDAREKLSGLGLKTKSKMIMIGFSAAGMFVNRFTMLHPSRVRIALIGSPGGWPMVPASKFKNEPLPYPIGTADLEALTGKPLDKRAFCTVPKLFYLGDEDGNDSVLYDDSYDPPHTALVRRLFGETPVDRWDDAEALYRRENCEAAFRLYAGAGHEITKEMLEDLIGFARDSLN